MDKRLLKIAGKIENGIGVIDVGTDHGYLPVFLAEQGYTGKLYASDINAGPLDTARMHAASCQLEDRISFLLCDGLSLCPPEEIDTIVIAGMGGDMICHILSSAPWTKDLRYKLILQPMTKQEILRAWLCDNGFQFLADEIVREGRLYQVLTVRFNGKSTQLTEAELYCGKYDLVKQCPEFHEYLNRLISRFEDIIDGQKKGSSSPPDERSAIVLAQLIELRYRNNENS